MNAVDKLIENIIRTKNPSVIGLDPDLRKIPSCYRANAKSAHPLEAAAQVIAAFNINVIDTIADLVPAVKPQIAFYEAYGSYGVAAFEQTVAYAKSKGLVVIEDAKRNDIGNTARAYAAGHLGCVALPDGSLVPSYDADFLTVTPFLGSESLQPFVEVCHSYGKGIFVLAKTSNIGSGEIQNAITKRGMTVSQSIAAYVQEHVADLMGEYGYSSMGAVVGATYPKEAAVLRQLMPKSYFLVPGYGAQGGGARDVLSCFCEDGLGAVINSSRGILYDHMSDEERRKCTSNEYLYSVKTAVNKMQEELYSSLKTTFSKMLY